jgi:hypothetical protein
VQEFKDSIKKKPAKKKKEPAPSRKHGKNLLTSLRKLTKKKKAGAPPSADKFADECMFYLN